MKESKQPLFEGYDDLIQIPLEKSDARSFMVIQGLLTRTGYTSRNPIGYLIEKLSGMVITPKESRGHWKSILEHKRKVESRLGRTMGIMPAVIDYYDQLGIDVVSVKMNNSSESVPPVSAPKKNSRLQAVASPQEMIYFNGNEIQNSNESSEDRVFTPGYHLERLKEEMMRARRYKHSLSAIMLNLDLKEIKNSDQAHIIEEKIITLVVKIIYKSIRTVDILARHSNDCFMLILPNTNKREAIELAERLKDNIVERMKRLPELAHACTVIIGVGQYTKDDSSIDFTQKLDNLTCAGREKRISTVLALD